MPRHELLARLRLWIDRMTDARMEALAADIQEAMPAVVAGVKHMLGGQEDAKGIARVLRERGCLREFLGR